MSSNFNALSSSLLSRTGGAAAPDFASGLAAGDTGGAEGLHFADWMAQHRDMQKPAMGMPTQAATVSVTAKMPLGQPNPSTVAKARPENRAASSMDKPKAPTPPAPAKAAEAPSAKANAMAKAADKGAGDKSSSDAIDEADAGREVAFKTAQGEASTWVQELQPPAELTTSDPAAMLAWLASLTQADANPAQPVAVPGADAPAGDLATDKAGDAGMGQDALSADTLSLALSGKDAGAAAGKGADAKDGPAIAGLGTAGKDALAQAAMGSGVQAEAAARSDQQTQDDGAIDFSTMMNREIGRSLQASKGPEAARHYTGSLATPVESPQFAQALSERVGMWISGAAVNGPMTAELRLNPAEMGPVHIRIELDGQNAVVDFAAANAQTREAIENSMATLSGAMEEIGLSLSGGGVSDQNAGQAWAGQQDAQNGRSSTSASLPDRLGAPSSPEPEPIRRSVPVANQRPGGLDLYA